MGISELEDRAESARLHSHTYNVHSLTCTAMQVQSFSRMVRYRLDYLLAKIGFTQLQRLFHAKREWCVLLCYSTLRYTTLHYTTLHYTTVYCTTLTALQYTALHSLHYSILHNTHCTTVQYIALHYGAFYCILLHWIVSYSAMLCCSMRC